MENGQHEGSILSTSITHDDISMPALVAQITSVSGAANVSPLRVIREYTALAAGLGGISPGEFLRWRLFDKEFYGDADLREFVGGRKMRDICLTVNFRRDWYALLSNKIASLTYLNAYGLPTPPTRAIYTSLIEKSEGSLLVGKESLERFLGEPHAYPLFGKPAESQNSLGSIALTDVDPVAKEGIGGGGKRVKISDLAAEIDANFGTGYILQEKVRPHPAIADICGDRLATVRFLTIIAEDGVRIFRTCLKIPAGRNMADNYWREGNLLARLNPSNGKVISVTSASGLETKDVREHPDTKAPLIGFAYPEWEAMQELALRAAKVMRYVPFIGWDIACTDKGPLIIEMNEFPDAFLMQFSERRGLLDPVFNAFIKFQQRNGAAFNAAMKARYASA